MRPRSVSSFEVSHKRCGGQIFCLSGSFLNACFLVVWWLLQVKADVYEKIDKELLTYVEDVLLNRRDDSTERLLDYAGTLDPKSKPTAVRKLADLAGPEITPRLNPTAPDVDPLAPDADLPPVPAYRAWQDPLTKSEAFGQLEALMKERIIFIDGAMGTMIQRYKLEEEDFRGQRCVGVRMHWHQQLPPCFLLQLLCSSVCAVCGFPEQLQGPRARPEGQQ